MGPPRETPPQAVLEQAQRGPVWPAAWGRHGARWLVEKSWGASPAGLLEAHPLGCQGVPCTRALYQATPGDTGEAALGTCLARSLQCRDPGRRARGGAGHCALQGLNTGTARETPPPVSLRGSVLTRLLTALAPKQNHLQSPEQAKKGGSEAEREQTES